MRCPRCNTEMMRTDLPELYGDRIFYTEECPACHYRQQVPKEKPKPRM